jgi:hypothetical protein
MNDLTDRELRARFKQLRAAELGDAPEFRELLGRANPATAGTDRNGRRLLSRVAIPVTLVAALVLAVGIARVERRRVAIQTPLSTWTSPTATLLRTPGIGLSAPRGILTSVLDRATSNSVLLKGTNR